MKYLIITEGTCELALINVLLDKKMLKIKLEDLFYESIFHLRQFTTKEINLFNSLPKEEKVQIIRIGDKLSDKLRIPKDIKQFVTYDVIDVCTRPELEILHIIKSGLYKEYLKCKSKYKPSEFIKNKIKEYRKSYDYQYNYFELCLKRN